jgi:hypothetical protein
MAVEVLRHDVPRVLLASSFSGNPFLRSFLTVCLQDLASLAVIADAESLAG